MVLLFIIFLIDLIINICKRSRNICPRIILEFLVFTQILLGICYFITYPMYMANVKVIGFTNIISYLEKNVLTAGIMSFAYILNGVLNLRYIRAIRDSRLIRNKCIIFCANFISILIMIMYFLTFLLFVILTFVGVIVLIFYRTPTVDLIIAIVIGIVSGFSLVLSFLTVIMSTICLMILFIYIFKMSMFISDPVVLKKNRKSMIIFVIIMTISLIISIICMFYVIFGVVNIVWKYFLGISFTFYTLFMSAYIISAYVLFRPSESLSSKMGKRSSIGMIVKKKKMNKVNETNEVKEIEELKEVKVYGDNETKCNENNQLKIIEATDCECTKKNNTEIDVYTVTNANDKTNNAMNNEIVVNNVNNNVNNEQNNIFVSKDLNGVDVHVSVNKTVVNVNVSLK